jgi:hypothetical protein
LSSASNIFAFFVLDTNPPSTRLKRGRRKKDRPEVGLSMIFGSESKVSAAMIPFRVIPVNGS